MSDALTSSSLVNSIKRRASIPENQSTFSTSDFLEMANEELKMLLLPEIMKLHEDYLLYQIDLPLESNKNEYNIPSRAIGNKLRDVQHKINDTDYVELTRTSIGRRFTEYGYQTQANLREYYIQNNKVVFVPPIGSNPTGSLSMIFYIKPSKLV